MQKIKEKIVKFLLWTQKWTKTDMLYIAKGGFWVYSSETALSLFALIIGIIFANMVDPNTYGTYRYVNSFLPILTIFTLNGMSTAITKTVSQGFDGSVEKITKTRIKYGLTSLIIGSGLSLYYFINGNHQLGLSFIIISIFIPFLNPLEGWMAILNGKKKFRDLSKYKIITSFIYTLILITTLLLTNNLLILIAINLGSSTIIHLLTYKIVSKKNINNKIEDSKAINYGKHLSVISVLGAMAQKLDDILIFHYLGPVQLAIYGFSKIPADKLNDFLRSLRVLILPKIAEKNIQEIKKGIWPKMLKIFIFVLVILAIYIPTVPYFFKLLLPKYIESIKYAQIMGLEILLLPMVLMTSSILIHSNKKSLYITNLSLPAIKIILLFILLPPLGILGGIMAILISKFLNLILTIFLFNNRKNFI